MDDCGGGEPFEVNQVVTCITCNECGRHMEVKRVDATHMEYRCPVGHGGTVETDSDGWVPLEGGTLDMHDLHIVGEGPRWCP